jgi:thiamine kinase
MSWVEACELDPSLLELGNSIAEPSFVQQQSGHTNRSWKLNFSHSPATLWRPVSAMTRAFRICREQESHILNFLTQHAAWLSPQAHFVNQHGLMVEWLEGELVTQIEDDQLIDLVSQLHQLNIDELAVAPFSFTTRIDHYWHQLGNDSSLSPIIHALYDKYRTIPSIASVAATLCHLDLGAHNLVKSRRGLQLIDWEYAAIADPRMELALLVDSTSIALEQLVKVYCQKRAIHDVRAWLDGVRAWLPRVRFMAGLWYFLAYQHWQNDDYLKAAHRYIDILCSEDHCLLHENNQ